MIATILSYLSYPNPALFNPQCVHMARYFNLKLALAGLQQTGVPFIKYDGRVLLPADLADDIGIYFIIPKIALALGLTIEQSMALFYDTMLYGAAIVGLVGMFQIWRSWPERLLSVLGIYQITRIVGGMMCVYRAPVALTLAIVPWVLYLVRYKKEISYPWYVLFGMAGLGMGFVHYVRSLAGVGTLLFLLVLLGYAAVGNWKKKLTAYLCLLVGLAIPVAYFQARTAEYHAFIKKELPHFQYVTPKHPFWASFFCGFGYLENRWGFRSSEGEGFVARLSFAKDPHVRPLVTTRSEQLARAEVLKLIKDDPVFFMQSLAAKLGVILFFFFLFYANIGLVAAYLFPVPWAINCAFFLDLVWSALPALMVTPQFMYLYNFIALSILFGVMSINNALEQGVFQLLWKAEPQKIKDSYEAI